LLLVIYLFSIFLYFFQFFSFVVLVRFAVHFALISNMPAICLHFKWNRRRFIVCPISVTPCPTPLPFCVPNPQMLILLSKASARCQVRRRRLQV